GWSATQPPIAVSDVFVPGQWRDVTHFGHYAVKFLPIPALGPYCDGIARPPGRYLVRERDAHKLINADVFLGGKFFHLLGQRIGHLCVDCLHIPALNLAKNWAGVKTPIPDTNFIAESVKL